MFKKLAISFAVMIVVAVPFAVSAQYGDNASRASDLRVQLHSILQELLNIESSTPSNSFTPGTNASSRVADTPAATATPNCPTPVRTLTIGSQGSDVTSLQEYLTRTGDYTYGTATGYFGGVTQAAVKRWQARNNVVSSGSPATTGFGVVGPKTRAQLRTSCNGDVTNELPRQNPPSNGGGYTNELPKVTPPSTGTGVAPGGTTSGSGSSGNGWDADSNVLFSASPTSGTSPLRVTFFSSKLDASGGYIIDYGDGSNSGKISASNAGTLVSTHTYSSAGTYTATIQPYYACMWQSSEVSCLLAIRPIAESITIHVSGTSNAVSFSASPTSGNEPLTVQFSAKNLSASTKYIIDYGDNENSGAITPSNIGSLTKSHKYTVPGTYTATIQPYVACMWGGTYRCMLQPRPIADEITINVRS